MDSLQTQDSRKLAVSRVTLSALFDLRLVNVTGVSVGDRIGVAARGPILFELELSAEDTVRMVAGRSDAASSPSRLSWKLSSSGSSFFSLRSAATMSPIIHVSPRSVSLCHASSALMRLIRMFATAVSSQVLQRSAAVVERFLSFSRRRTLDSSWLRLERRGQKWKGMVC
jgi:hypothetical protein